MRISNPQVFSRFSCWRKQATLHLRRQAFSSLKTVIILLKEVALQEDACCHQDPPQSLLVVMRSIIRVTSTQSDVGRNSWYAEELQSCCQIRERCELLILTASSFHLPILPFGASLVAQMVKGLPAMQETQVRSLGQENPLEKEMATHSSILAWRISWTEEPGKLQCMGSQSQIELKRLSTQASGIQILTQKMPFSSYQFLSITRSNFALT